MAGASDPAVAAALEAQSKSIDAQSRTLAAQSKLLQQLCARTMVHPPYIPHVPAMIPNHETFDLHQPSSVGSGGS